MKVHHLNLGTMCPFGGSLFGGEGSVLSSYRIVCHCLLIEAGDQLILVDTGFGTDDVADPRRLGPARFLLRTKLNPAEPAIAQIRALGLDPADVRNIVPTHLDIDHAGGLPDFPNADVHVFPAEKAAMENPSWRERERYRKAHFAHGPSFVEHEVEGDSWFGFESVRLLPGIDAEIALVPLPGHSRGHTAVALNTESGWLLHCGDAFFHRSEVQTPPACPPGLRVFEGIVGWNNDLRKHNQERLQELGRDHGDEVTIFCSHDHTQLEQFSSA
jgi:glyoxylase-like metal-dependent hydrolase (beta-lactamase superfamily II)